MSTSPVRVDTRDTGLLAVLCAHEPYPAALTCSRRRPLAWNAAMAALFARSPGSLPRGALRFGALSFVPVTARFGAVDEPPPTALLLVVYLPADDRTRRRLWAAFDARA